MTMWRSRSNSASSIRPSLPLPVTAPQHIASTVQGSFQAITEKRLITARRVAARLGVNVLVKGEVADSPLGRVLGSTRW